MTSIQDFLSLATTLAALGLVAAGIMKLFQIAGDLHEMKEVLKDMRRISQGLGSPVAAAVPVTGVAALSAVLPSGIPPAPSGIPSPAASIQPAPSNIPSASLSSEPAQPFSPAGGYAGTPPTPEELVRAVHAQNFSGDEFPL
jgi:hypothetical protein